MADERREGEGGAGQRHPRLRPREPVLQFPGPVDRAQQRGAEEGDPEDVDPAPRPER
ncbi:hypothetical protein ODJ75_01385 [Streptomyces sp. HB2AG]|nr:hypothetical protein [Streptomyces sp. HB2AG]MCZ2523346.1 hypothetical protein [Streptomyces sp. HB2AG]